MTHEHKTYSLEDFVPNPKRNKDLGLQARLRDRNICQCCYTTSDNALAAHHIHPLCFGGEDSLDNMVILCEECHRYAPDDPSKFLDYQRRGGRNSCTLLMSCMEDFLLEEENATIQEVWDCFCEEKHGRYLVSWKTRSFKPIPGTRGKNVLTKEEADSMLRAAIDYKEAFRISLM